MIKFSGQTEPAAALRRKAEALFQDSLGRAKDPAGPLSPEEALHTLHELQLYQIEMEMQNEELRLAQLELDASRVRYTELYDHAPVGYCTLSDQGILLEANLTLATLLGEARDVVLRQALTRFILPEDQDVYYLHAKRLRKTGLQQACDLRLLRKGAGSFWAHLEATTGRDAAGGLLDLVVVSDITGRKAAEHEKAGLLAKLLLSQSPEGSGPGLQAFDASLSRREAEVLTLVGRGLTSKQIGEILFISSRTVDSHRFRIMQKLGIANGPGLVKYALEHSQQGLAKDLPN
jgi:PAS domain S-box-containing protein